MKGQGPSIYKQRLSVIVVNEYSQLFYSLRSESKRIWIYSLHIRMFRYICKRHLFTSFA
jgi:hypothetical protein